ncbi:hypothetical protein MPSEU_000848200 [Mayamaea pseudoterrestris]|nr:hypothetical protein MPSEU_000848200 [Mayamaea pseudoterrestris]
MLQPSAVNDSDSWSHTNCSTTLHLALQFTMTRHAILRLVGVVLCCYTSFAWSPHESIHSNLSAAPNCSHSSPPTQRISELIRGSRRRIQTLASFPIPGFTMTMKVGSKGLDLLTFSDELETVTEKHLSDVLLDQIPTTGPLGQDNFKDFVLENAVSASPYDDIDVLLQVNFTGGAIFANTSLLSNATFVQTTMFDSIKAAFLIADGYNTFVARIEANAELQRIKGVKISVNPYFGPAPPLPSNAPTMAPASNSPSEADDAAVIGTMMIAVIVIVIIVLVAGCLGTWYYCNQRKAKERRRQVAKLAKQRSDRALLRKHQSSRSLGTNSTITMSGIDGSMSSMNGSARNVAAGSMTNGASLSPIRQSPASSMGQKNVPPAAFSRPSLQSRRAISLMAITEDEDESEASGDVGSETRSSSRGSAKQKRLIASDSALGERDLSNSSGTEDHIYVFDTSVPKLWASDASINQQHLPFTDEDGNEDGDDDEDDELISGASSADERFEDEYKAQYHGREAL